MSRKLLFTDLDGTLLNDKKQVSPDNEKAIQKAISLGHKVTIATGRPLISGRMIAQQIGLDRSGCYLISYNGAVIYDFEQDKAIRDIRLNMEDTKYLFQEADKNQIYMHTYQNNKVIAEKVTPELLYYTKEGSMDYTIVNDVVSALTHGPHKVLLADLTESGRLQKFQKDNENWTKGRCVSFFSSKYYLEYCPLGATKGDGVRFLSDYLEIPITDTVAVGDEQNDISMIQAAEVGVVMKNGNPEIFKYGNYRTENDNNHNGIAEVINKFILE